MKIFNQIYLFFIFVTIGSIFSSDVGYENAAVVAYKNSIKKIKFPLIEEVCALPDALFDFQMVESVKRDLLDILNEIFQTSTAKEVKNNILWNLKITQLKKTIHEFKLLAHKAKEKILKIPSAINFGLHGLTSLIYLRSLWNDNSETVNTFSVTISTLGLTVISANLMNGAIAFLFRFTKKMKALEEINKFYDITLDHLPVL